MNFFSLYYYFFLNNIIIIKIEKKKGIIFYLFLKKNKFFQIFQHFKIKHGSIMLIRSNQFYFFMIADSQSL